MKRRNGFRDDSHGPRRHPGLVFATFATLVFVPTIYRLLRSYAARPAAAPTEGARHAIIY